MIMQFFLWYRDDTDDYRGWIKTNPSIMIHYIRFWFIIDFVSIFPFDLLAVTNSLDDSLNDLKVIRIVRLCRLAKLARVARAGRMFRRWEAVLSFSYGMQSIIKFVFAILACAHLIACS
jgi:potassium voltage-gated channel Eag-related subfamily H protein 7